MAFSNTVARTKTGGFPIGFRRMWFDWQKDLDGLLAWAGEEGLSVIDLGREVTELAPKVLKAGLRLGSIDLPEWGGMISPDDAERKDAVAQNAAYIKTCASFGPLNYFVVMLPKKADLPRAENFSYMVDSYAELAPVLEAHAAKLVIEGWPGPGALCCTPEGYGSFFKACPSPALGVNYDPSHLIRMGIDPVRFLREFVDRVYHVHGKDTELFSEGLYTYGNAQEATLGKPHGFGGMHWRYTTPGSGLSPWPEIFGILVEAGYKGAVSIELEDEKFCGTPEGEKAGILRGRDFLRES